MNIVFLKDLTLIDGYEKEWIFKTGKIYSMTDSHAKELISQGYAQMPQESPANQLGIE